MSGARSPQASAQRPDRGCVARLVLSFAVAWALVLGVSATWASATSTPVPTEEASSAEVAPSPPESEGAEPAPPAPDPAPVDPTESEGPEDPGDPEPGPSPTESEEPSEGEVEHPGGDLPQPADPLPTDEDAGASVADSTVSESTVIAYASRPSEIFLAAEDGSYRHLSYSQWQALGSPTPTVLDIKFLASPWSDSIYRATPGASEHIGYGAWQRAGSPTPGSAITATAKLSWSATVYALISFSYDGSSPTAKPLSPSQWREIGLLPPATVAHVPGSTYYRWASNGAEIFVATPDSAQHKLTFPQWSSAGAPTPQVRAGGYLTVPWTSTIWFFPDITSAAGGTAVSYRAWTDASQPTPRTVGSVPGGVFYRYWGTSEIRYRAHGADSYVTPEGWRFAGYPAPTIEYLPVFVYGTLRPGERNWGVVAGSVVSTRAARRANASLYVNPSGTAPLMVAGGAGVVGDSLTLESGTYAATIARLDRLENYDPSKPPQSQVYYRAVITLVDGSRAFAYLTSDWYSAFIRQTGKFIPSGDWKRR